MNKISILLTSYNIEGYIDVSIASVVAQEFPCDWELLIGDDGSTDGTIEKIEKWVGQYPNNIKLYQWTKDDCHGMLGSRAAINRANLLEKASGNYFIYLDGDDCWLGTDKLKVQYEILEKPENAECSCCGHDIEWFDEDTKLARPVKSLALESRKFTPEQYWHNRFYIHTNTILFRSKCKTLMLENTNRGFMNDTFITFCMLQYGSFYYIPQTWARYNITGRGLYTGATKAYKSIRDLVYSEKKHSINPKLETNEMVLTNVVRSLNAYDGKSEREKIKSLLENLDKNTFKFSHLVYAKAEKSPQIRLAIANVYIKYYFIRILNKLNILHL